MRWGSNWTGVVIQMKIGAFGLVHWLDSDGFLGIECKKGRGLILPGGTYDPTIDRTYHDTARRELKEETGVEVHSSYIQYLWCGPDGGDYMTFAFYCPHVTQWSPTETAEGKPCRVTWNDLFQSRFAAHYRVLFDVLRDSHRPELNNLVY